MTYSVAADLRTISLAVAILTLQVSVSCGPAARRRPVRLLFGSDEDSTFRGEVEIRRGRGFDIRAPVC